MPRDPRLIQIMILSSLVTIGSMADRVAVLWPMALTAIVGCQLVAFASHVHYAGWRARASYWPQYALSPLITSLSLTLLLRTTEWWVMALAVLVAIGSKSLLRFEGRHLFNPANIGIVAALIFTDAAWISPGQWGQSTIVALFLVGAAGAVLSRAGSWDVSAMFLGSFAMLVVARALWLGDPLSIPLHQLQSGALLIFTFFMISDPKTVPASRWARAAFAFAVALTAYLLQFELYIREGVIYALFLVSLTRWGMLYAARYVGIYQLAQTTHSTKQPAAGCAYGCD